MSNKAEVISSIHAAQDLMNEDLTIFKAAITRPTLESILHSYVDRYRANMRHMSDNKVIETPAPVKLKGFITITCASCEGTGIYAPNGGPCFRCTGKGHQLEADQKRNYGYDLHHPHVSAPAPVQAVLALEVTPTPVEVTDVNDDPPF